MTNPLEAVAQSHTFQNPSQAEAEDFSDKVDRCRVVPMYNNNGAIITARNRSVRMLRVNCGW